MAVPVSELQKINPSSIIELFSLQLITNLHGSNDIYRFHNGTSPNANGDVVWAGNSYMKIPCEFEGVEWKGKGALPRPQFKVGNVLGTITAIMLDTNKVTTGVDLNGSKLTRIRTLARYLDAANWSTGTNPFGTPDPNAELPQQIFYLDRKISESRDLVEWECASAFDLAYGPKAPKRLITRANFPGVGTFIG